MTAQASLALRNSHLQPRNTLRCRKVADVSMSGARSAYRPDAITGGPLAWVRGGHAPGHSHLGTSGVGQGKTPNASSSPYSVHRHVHTHTQPRDRGDSRSPSAVTPWLHHFPTEVEPCFPDMYTLSPTLYNKHFPRHALDEKMLLESHLRDQRVKTSLGNLQWCRWPFSLSPPSPISSRHHRAIL